MDGVGDLVGRVDVYVGEAGTVLGEGLFARVHLLPDRDDRQRVLAVLRSLDVTVRGAVEDVVIEV